MRRYTMSDWIQLAKAVCGAVVSFFVGLHLMIQLLVYAIAFDIATGLVAAWIAGSVSSEVSRRGIARKTLVLLGVAAAEMFGRASGLQVTVPWGGSWGLGAAVAGYYCIHEALSIVENLVRAGVPVPQFVTDKLARLRESADGVKQ
jgi:toxin secretion/phage lysis holin